ncbi:hypothetical protein TNCV_1885301 [Trichonephila clavipes]|nr:hypothetical protein TNCV_1885301 [Trichonephila clavipes]
MTSNYHLNNSLRWRAVGRLEVDKSEAEIARWLQVARKWSLGFGINSKDVVLPPEMSAKVATKHRYLHRISTWH